MDIATVYVDTTILRSTVCSTAATLRHGHGLTTPDEKATLRSGSDAHAALAVYFKTGSARRAMATFEGLYRAWADEHVPPDDRLAWYNVGTVLEAWLDAHPLNSFPFATPHPDLIEVGFAYPLTDDGTCACGHHREDHHRVDGDDYAGRCLLCETCARYTDLVFTGRCDGIVAAPDGTWAILEHKTTGQINALWLRQWRMDAQVSGYIWAAQQHADRPILGAFINAIEFSRLPSDPTRKCTKHAVAFAECRAQHAKWDGVVTQRTPEALVAWRHTAIALGNRYRQLVQATPALTEEAIAALPMEGTFRRECGWCFAADWCGAGRPVGVLGTLFVEDFWKPYDYAMTGVA